MTTVHSPLGVLAQTQCLETPLHLLVQVIFCEHIDQTDPVYGGALQRLKLTQTHAW